MILMARIETRRRRGMAVGVPWREAVGHEAFTLEKIGAALERIRQLAPFAKPAVLKACVEAAAADGEVRPVEAELVRMVAATLDCPMPPLLTRRNPQALAA